jgi:transcriptional regulator with XRE-family HTH domain
MPIYDGLSHAASQKRGLNDNTRRGRLMNEDMIQIAARIRELREIYSFTEEELAIELGVGLEQYRQFERDGHNIPISVLYHIAQKFGVDMTEILTGKTARLSTYEICRRGQGQTIERFSGYQYENLAPKFANKIMEPMLVTLYPGDKEAAPIFHRGQEFNLVLEGTVAFTYDGMEIMLAAGDAIYFDSTHPHSQRAAGDTKCRFLTVIVE